MRLVMDVGNTNIVAGIFHENEMIHSFRLSTDKTKTEYEIAVLLKLMISSKSISANEVNGAIISSVVPVLTNSVAKAVEILCYIKPLILSAGLKTGLDIKTDNPSQTGADRIADSVGALLDYKPPIVIIDIGTAVTLSVINSKRQFLGGIITAGPRLELNALKKSTAQLPEVSLQAPKKVIGKNTVNAMASGIIHGTASMIDSLIARIEIELGEKVTAIATGGLSNIIIPCCKKEIIHDELLLLKGLNYIYEKNKVNC